MRNRTPVLFVSIALMVSCSTAPPRLELPELPVGAETAWIEALGLE